MKENSKGGARTGAGRKPSADPKQPVTIFVETSIIDSLGGKEGVQFVCYGAIYGTPFSAPKVPDVIGIKKKFPPPDDEIKQKAPKEKKRPVVHLNKPMGVLESPKTIAHSTTFDEKGEVIEDLKVTQPVGKPEISKFEQAIAGAAKDAILKEIEAIRAEKCPKERDTPMGRRSWAVDQHKRIQELQNKLK